MKGLDEEAKKLRGQLSELKDEVAALEAQRSRLASAPITVDIVKDVTRLTKEKVFYRNASLNLVAPIQSSTERTHSHSLSSHSCNIFHLHFIPPSSLPSVLLL